MLPTYAAIAASTALVVAAIFLPLLITHLSGFRNKPPQDTHRDS